MQKLSVISITILVGLVAAGSIAIIVTNPYGGQKQLPLVQTQNAATATSATSSSQSPTASTNSTQSSLLTPTSTSTGHAGDDGGSGDN